MNHFSFISLAVLGLIVVIATSHTATAALSLPPKSFGGRIYLAPIPGVTCVGTGKLMVLSSNVKALTNIVKKIGQAPTAQKALEHVNDIYNIMPTYTTDPAKVPQPGKQILGNEKWIPDLKTCTAFNVPIPVLKTTQNYNVSR